MRRLWIAVNVGLIAVSAYGGYQNVQPQELLKINVDWTFVAISFALCALFPWGAMIYSRSRGITQWRRPSLDRNPLRWWTDTLQPLRMSVIAAFTSTLGGAVGLLDADQQGLMLFWWSMAMLIGLLLGERIVYLRFATQII